MKITHIFYTPWTGKTPKGDHQTQEWYDFRFELFNKYTVESLKAQTDKDFIFWASFRPEDKNNPTTKKIDQVLTEAGIKHLLSFNGTMMTEDRATWHNVDQVERLGKALPELKELVGPTDWIHETNLDSDDTVHKDFNKIVRSKEPRLHGGLFMKEGYALHTNGEMAEWNNPFSNQNYTVMFPEDIYYDPVRRLVHLRGLDSHEQVPDLFDSEELKGRLYMTIIHGDNISTIWDHKYRGKLVDSNIKKQFIN